MNRNHIIAMVSAAVSLLLLIAGTTLVFAHDDGELPTGPNSAIANITLDDTPNYSEHVQPIMQANCISCHTEGEIGHDIFSMETPEEIITLEAIALVTQINYMPPWPPSANSPHYLYE